MASRWMKSFIFTISASVLLSSLSSCAFIDGMKNQPDQKPNTSQNNVLKTKKIAEPSAISPIDNQDSGATEAAKMIHPITH